MGLHRGELSDAVAKAGRALDLIQEAIDRDDPVAVVLGVDQLETLLSYAKGAYGGAVRITRPEDERKVKVGPALIQVYVPHARAWTDERRLQANGVWEA